MGQDRTGQDITTRDRMTEDWVKGRSTFMQKKSSDGNKARGEGGLGLNGTPIKKKKSRFSLEERKEPVRKRIVRKCRLLVSVWPGGSWAGRRSRPRWSTSRSPRRA